MNVDVFTLCDFAQNTPGNKMNIVGTFNRIFARQIPAVHPLCALAVLMRFEQIEHGTKNIRVSIIDSDGRPVVPILEAQMNVQISPNESDASVPLAVVIQQISLPRFGEYSVGSCRRWTPGSFHSPVRVAGSAATANASAFSHLAVNGFFFLFLRLC